MDENILRRIQKCLALSQSPEPHEAAAALRQATKLMELHGVSQVHLKRAELGNASFNSRASATVTKDWEVALLARIGSAFGCKLMFAKSYPYGIYTLVGLKTQVELAQYTCEVMGRQLMKARAKFVADHNPIWDRHFCSRKDRATEADTFCRGWVRGATKTIHAFAHPAETQEAINALYDEVTAGREAKSQVRKGSANAYWAGSDAAADVSIHRPMHGKADQLKIGA